MPQVLGSTPRRRGEGRKVRASACVADGSEQEMVGDHVITATGYKVAVGRLNFLTPELRAKVKSVNGTPELNSNFESSVPGLYFTGLAAANSFGPVMRFMFGAGFAAQRYGIVAKSLKRIPRQFGRQRRDDRGMSDPARLILRYCCLNRLPAAARHGFFNSCF